MTIAQFIGRTIDVAAFQGTQSSGEVQLDQSLADPGGSGKVITGIVKLGQRVLVELLTPKGSIPHWPSRGSTFMTEMRSQTIRTPAELQAALSRGLLDVRRNLIVEEKDTDPLDERLGKITIQNAEFTGDKAKVFIDVNSLDPEAKAILPIEVSV